MNIVNSNLSRLGEICNNVFIGNFSTNFKLSYEVMNHLRFDLYYFLNQYSENFIQFCTACMTQFFFGIIVFLWSVKME